MFEWQGKGIMQEAIKSVIEYGFRSMKIELVEAIPNPTNLKSISLLKRNNFIRGESFTETDFIDVKKYERVTYLLKNNNNDLLFN